MNRRQRDKIRWDFGSVCEMWGYRADSGVGKLIDHLYGEHRIKYGINYRLERVGKNKFTVLQGDREHLDLWESEILEHFTEFKISRGDPNEIQSR